MCRFFTILFALLLVLPLGAQETVQPFIKGSISSESVQLDGRLNDPAWAGADSIPNLTMIEPTAGLPPTYRTVVKVLLSPKNIFLGIRCYDAEPEKIVAFSKARDAELEDEDYIKVILDTYHDGRNGYIFAINPFGARYDALVSNNGESENPNWDGAWEARTRTDAKGWSAEIRIPVSTMTYNKALDTWGFNVERRIQRLLEVNRWSAISMDYTIGQTRHAGDLTDLQGFNPGIGLTPIASMVVKATQDATLPTDLDLKPSLDLTQRITSDITAQITVNTDFAETEVDSRQTNLTRFPILYPEKRQFFLEGADIYDFGISLGRSLMPFYSRRIGLYEGNEVPVLWGGKINGKVKNTHFGSLFTQTRAVDSIVPASQMGVVRVKQNILKESSFGMIATMGDPGGRQGAGTAGLDFTFQTSTLNKNKNFIVGLWGMYNVREGLEGDRSAAGIKIDYPNDLFDWFVQYRRIGDAFDPSMGFSARKGVVWYSAKLDYMPRPENKWIRQHKFKLSPTLYTDLFNQWESYGIQMSPFNASFESGDRLEFSLEPQGEFLKAPFEISDGVVIDEGAYHYTRFQLEAQTASKRAINGMAAGNFNKELIATRAALNISSDLNLSLFVQYDNESGSMGTYSRLRWTFAPLGDLFIVYKHNMQPAIPDRWQQDQNQLILKLTYGLAL